MKVDGHHYRSVWLTNNGLSIAVVDQTQLPFCFEVRTLRSCDEVVLAIKNMVVRGAPLIGASAACGLRLATLEDPSDDYLQTQALALIAARPTAINLRWAVDRVCSRLLQANPKQRADIALQEAQTICDEDVDNNACIGTHGETVFVEHWRAKGGTDPLNVLTHCNAGWLATVDWGTALAPVFKAHDAGIPIHVWVDETRPRNQGAALTAWELKAHGVPHTVIVDNAGGHLMQQGQVDLCIVGSDRTTRAGDVCNKIGTYLKALAARDNDVPFYVAVPSSTIDWNISDGRKEIPIEERNKDEVLYVHGIDLDNVPTQVRVTTTSDALNPAFDITPKHLVTGLITERGICAADELELLKLFPENRTPT